MSEPAYELTLEDLADSPHLWGEALRSVARGRVGAWSTWSKAIMSMSLTSFLTVPSKSWKRPSRSSLIPRQYAR